MPWCLSLTYAHGRLQSTSPQPTWTRVFPLFLATADAEHTRARKRQRIDSPSGFTAPTHNLLDHSSALATTSSRSTMKLSESTLDSILSTSPEISSEAGPSLSGYDGVASTNGHTNGHVYPVMTNGSSSGLGGGHKHGKGIARVSLPGTTISDDSLINREEFIRLIVQSLRDVGYMYVPRRLRPCSVHFFFPKLTTCVPFNPVIRWTVNRQQPSKQSPGIQWKHHK